LKPILGLELTATPFVETPRGPMAFKNVVFDYPLGRAIADGFVKEPAVVTRENFIAAGKSPEALQQIKLEDGIRLHESVKVELETYAREAGVRIIKPFMLVIARDTTHAKELIDLIKSVRFFAGRYADKVIQVDSSVKEEETIERLLKVEDAKEPTEIVIHVNMLKEGWDVTNLYTIVPLRAANARTLIEQSIGRGLRLPYGKRTGVTAVDRLNIVAHDRFQEIVDEANKPDSGIRLQQVILTDDQLKQSTRTVVSEPKLMTELGLGSRQTVAETSPTRGLEAAKPIFDAEEQKVARIAYDVIRKLENQPEKMPSVTYLQNADVQAAVLREVASQYRPAQLELDRVTKTPDFASIVSRTSDAFVRRTIDIPRILVLPKGEVKSGYHPFTLDLSGMRYEAPNDTLWAAHLRTGKIDRIGVGQGSVDEQKLEDYVVGGLIDFDDVAYDAHADLLYDLAGQVVRHLTDYLSEEDARKVLRLHQREIARFIHVQMQKHFWQDTSAGIEVVVKRGFTAILPSAYTTSASEPILDFKSPPPDKNNIARYLFGGFKRCLFSEQKFHSDTERRLAVILDRESEKWFKPAKRQFQLFYRSGIDHLEYQPDFVAEMFDRVLMLEPKASNQMTDTEVLAKRDVAVEWCKRASEYVLTYGGKPWTYALIPHDAIADNMTIEGLVAQYRKSDL
jgi:type III restriction enzyme